MEVSPSVSIPSNSVLALPTLDFRSKSDGDRVATYALLFSCLVCVHAAGTLYANKCRQLGPAKPYKSAIWYRHLDPIFGLDILWPYIRAFSQNRLLEWTREVVSAYGRTVSWLCLGRQAVLTYDPVNVKAILTGQFEEFGLGETRMKGWEPLFGNGISNSEGALWKHHRITLRPLLARVRDVELDIFENHFQALQAVVPRDGTTFDIQQLFGSFILDASTEVFLGASTKLLTAHKAQNTEGQKFADAFDYAQRVVIGMDNLNVSSLVRRLIFGDHQLQESLEITNQFIYKILDCAVQQHEEGIAQGKIYQAQDESLLSTLIAEGRSRSEIKGDIINIIVATRDTTMAYLSSVWYLLSKHPDVYDKIRIEISVLDGKAPAKEDLNRFPYLQMVLQEVIRLFPPVAINQRTAEVDTILPRGGGLDGQSPMLVRRGTSVGYSVYAMHRIPESFGADADDFRPERWSEIRPGPAYMPFHAGPRTCLGKQFAQAMVKYCTIRLIQNLPRPQDRNDRPWQEKLSMNCCSKHGVQIAF